MQPVAPEERTRRRAAELTRMRRQRRLAALALVLAAAGALAAVALSRSSSRATTTSTQQAAAAADTVPVRTVVAGSKPNEQTTTAATTASRTRTAENAAAAPLRGKTVAIDPGHNGGNYLHTAEINRLVDAGTLRKACDTTGTETSDCYTEATYNLDVSLRLAKILRAEGAHVVLTRTTNTGWGPCITERAAIGNRAHADAAISIHADGGPASGRGFHVIYPPPEAGLITADLAATDRRLALDVRDTYRACRCRKPGFTPEFVLSSGNAASRPSATTVVGMGGRVAFYASVARHHPSYLSTRVRTVRWPYRPPQLEAESE